MAQRKVSCEVYTDRGVVGPRGASAYEQAVEGGYTGTLEEFEAILATDLNTVADNVEDISTVADNIEDISQAVVSAENARKWAEGTDDEVVGIGGTHSAKTWAGEAADSATSAESSATTAGQYYDSIYTWIQELERVKEGDVNTYTAGTSTSTYDGSLTTFPVESHFIAPINVFVNGQYKELTTEYTEDKTNNTITFTTALNSGDKVNIVSNLSLVDIEDVEIIDESISTHNSSSSAHSTLFSGKEDSSNKTTTLSGSSTDTQYPSAKVVYDNLVLKQDKSNLVTSLSSSSTDVQYPSAKLAYDQLLLKQNKVLDTPVLIDGVSKTTVQDTLDATAIALAGRANTSLSNLTDAGQIKVAHLAMPSGTNEDLTPGASGTSYTAPADGYFFASAVPSGAVAARVSLSSNGVNSTALNDIGWGLYTWLPVEKGAEVTLSYFINSGSLSFNSFKFIYAEGAKSEAN